MGVSIVYDAPTYDGRGIFVVVEIACTNSNDMKVYQKAFWLPKGLVKAVLTLRDIIHMNRLDNIPDDKCTKAVTFKIKNVEPTIAFYKLVKNLTDIGVIVKIENAPKHMVEELRRLGNKVEVV